MNDPKRRGNHSEQLSKMNEIHDTFPVKISLAFTSFLEITLHLAISFCTFVYQTAEVVVKLKVIARKKAIAKVIFTEKLIMKVILTITSSDWSDFPLDPKCANLCDRRCDYLGKS